LKYATTNTAVNISFLYICDQPDDSYRH